MCFKLHSLRNLYTKKTSKEFQLSTKKLKGKLFYL